MLYGLLWISLFSLNSSFGLFSSSVCRLRNLLVFWFSVLCSCWCRLCILLWVVFIVLCSCLSLVFILVVGMCCLVIFSMCGRWICVCLSVLLCEVLWLFSSIVLDVVCDVVLVVGCDGCFGMFSCFC